MDKQSNPPVDEDDIDTPAVEGTAEKMDLQRPALKDVKKTPATDTPARYKANEVASPELSGSA